ncbi:MAG: 1,2-phenylacetyl-CoA epoxidase subunit PaaD [Bacteroidia bacterium]
MITEAEVYQALEEVRDPEIPVISVVDLGIIRDVLIASDGGVTVQLTPTFAGCPAIHQMKDDILRVLKDHGASDTRVDVMYNEPWSSNLISPKGRQILKDFGLSPPPAFDGMLTLEVLENAVCPKCSSNNTYLISPFGPTACRAVHHCRNCQETFQQFKPL